MNKVRCPICDQEMPGHRADWPDYPFCSPRCRKIDLGRWLSEEYRIPSPSTEDTEESSKSSDDEE